MFVVSTVRGINLVFNDVADLEVHIKNLQEYHEQCKQSNDFRIPVYGLYPEDANMRVCSDLTRSLQAIFSPEPIPQATLTKDGEYIQ